MQPGAEQGYAIPPLDAEQNLWLDIDAEQRLDDVGGRFGSPEITAILLLFLGCTAVRTTNPQPGGVAFRLGT
ncbi:hypothetical protein AB0L71_16200 [Streptomyces sp. NPDC052052]|uniref:hypothetical protein n=1 Tax=Streptomyces sp. NPDC052052 TaxID=3154756 RepID=UPI003444EA15